MREIEGHLFLPGRMRWPHELAIWLATITPALLMFCHATAILPLAWERRPVSDFQPQPGGHFVTLLPSRWMSQELTGDSPAALLENGHPLPMPNSAPEEIERRGGGRYALRGGAIYLSTPDNSDPRVNGRSYELLMPWEPPLTLVVCVGLTAFAGTVRMLAVNHAAVLAVILRPPLLLPVSVYLLIALLGRLWYLMDFRLPGLYGDSGSYYQLAQAISTGQWPEFGIRTPGYPLLLSAVFAFSDSVSAVVLVQNALTVVASLTMIAACHAFRRSLSLWAAIGMGVYTVGVWVFYSDTALLSDGPYAQAIIFSLAFLLLGLLRRDARYLALSSMAMAAAILFRPAGLFLLVIHALCVGYLWWNAYPRRAIAAMAIPLPALLLALAVYNNVTIKTFTLTAFGESQIAFATFTFWEEDASYPANINDAIGRTRRMMQDRIGDEGRALLAASWDFRSLAPIFLAGFHYPTLDEATRLDGTVDYMAARAWVRRISFDSIAKHPRSYLKFVLTQLWLFYISNPRDQEDFITHARYRIHDIYVSGRFERGKGDPLLQEMAREWADKPVLPGFTVVGAADDAEIIVRQDSVLRRLNRYLVFVRRVVFGNVFWTGLYVVSLLIAPIALWRSRGCHPGAFAAVAMTLTVLGASLVVALVEYGSYRYSAPTEFVYFLPLLPLMFVSPETPAAFEKP